MLGIFKVKDKERPATPETPEDSWVRCVVVMVGDKPTSHTTPSTTRPESLQNLQKQTEATSRQSTPQTQLQYERKLNVNGVELYQLFTSNSREDIIQECVKAEAIMRQLGSEAVFRTRVDFLGIPRLDQVNLKEALADYLWTLYDLIDERIAIQQS